MGSRGGLGGGAGFWSSLDPDRKLLPKHRKFVQNLEYHKNLVRVKKSVIFFITLALLRQSV